MDGWIEGWVDEGLMDRIMEGWLEEGMDVEGSMEGCME